MAENKAPEHQPIRVPGSIDKKILQMAKGQPRHAGGRPTRRGSRTGLAFPPRESEIPVDDMTEAEAEEELLARLSPVHAALKQVRDLEKIRAEGGKAGADAGRLLQEISRQWIKPVRKTVDIKLSLG